MSMAGATGRESRPGALVGVSWPGGQTLASPRPCGPDDRGLGTGLEPGDHDGNRVRFVSSSVRNGDEHLVAGELDGEGGNRTHDTTIFSRAALGRSRARTPCKSRLSRRRAGCSDTGRYGRISAGLGLKRGARSKTAMRRRLQLNSSSSTVAAPDVVRRATASWRWLGAGRPGRWCSELICEAGGCYSSASRPRTAAPRVPRGPRGTCRPRQLSRSWRVGRLMRSKAVSLVSTRSSWMRRRRGRSRTIARLGLPRAQRFRLDRLDSAIAAGLASLDRCDASCQSSRS